MKHQNKKKRRPTLEDFSDRKTDDREEAKTLENENSEKNERPPEPIPSLDAKLQEFEKTLMRAIDQKLNEFQAKMIPADRKSHCKKKNDRVLYVGDETYPTFQKFKESPNEPLKETLKKVARAAEKYLELTGGSKPH